MGCTISTKPMCCRRPPKGRPTIVHEQEIKIIDKESNIDEHCHATPGDSRTNFGKVNNRMQKVTVNTFCWIV